MRRRALTLLVTGALAFGLAACDGNAQDDLQNIEENVEEGVSDVGEGVSDVGSEMQDADDDEG